MNKAQAQIPVASDKTVKKQKLIALANSILQDPQYQPLFDKMLAHYKLDYDTVIDSFLEYNLDIFDEQGNAVYNSIHNRIVLYIHNLIQGSWHIERQATVNDFLKEVNAIKIADIGFGVPSHYTQEILKSDKNVKLSLCDLYSTAFDFAEVLLGQWHSDWSAKIDFIYTNMDTNDFIGDYDLYIFQDSIEHTPDPSTYLKKYTALSPAHSHFLFSLPIGPLIPRHYIAWKTAQEAQDWLASCGLEVIKTKNIFVNLEVDLFAEDLGADFHNYIVLCRKIRKS